MWWRYQAVFIPAGRIVSRLIRARRSVVSLQIDMERGDRFAFDQNRGSEQLAQCHRGFGAREVQAGELGAILVDDCLIEIFDVKEIAGHEISISSPDLADVAKNFRTGTDQKCAYDAF
jgi:hypothetical protein